MFTIGNNWYNGNCQDPNENTEEDGKIFLGYFLDFEYGNAEYDGMSACLLNCKIFGLTGCEYHRGDGRCSAHTHPLVMRKRSYL